MHKDVILILEMKKGTKQTDRQPHGEIKPFQVYSTMQVVGLLGVNPRKVRTLAKDMDAKRVGKEYKFLGEKILNYMGSAPIGASPIIDNNQASGEYHIDENVNLEKESSI